MPSIDTDALASVVVRVPNYPTLTPAERAEFIRIAQGFACKDSASAADVSPETIRARRKSIYRKLDVPGHGEIISALLSLSLQRLAERDRVTSSSGQLRNEAPPDGPVSHSQIG
jgi:DNA-binding CsgD family transcriptional regulator